MVPSWAEKMNMKELEKTFYTVPLHPQGINYCNTLI